ncbi:MAG: hypothetical protein ACOZQL_17155 [Myxococcota bacterium]
MRALLPAFALLVSACGYTSPGGGTGTLFVTARLTSEGSTASSRARVTVRAGSMSGAIVEDAEVSIRGGALQKTVVPFDRDSSQYRLDGFQWVEGLRLEVVRGSDLLDGSIDVPGETLITDPINDSTFRRADGQPLVVRWKDARGSPATTTGVRLEKAKLDRTIPQGIFEFRVEANELVANDKERVRVERSNEVTLAGGAAGSVLSAATDHSIEFRVE